MNKVRVIAVMATLALILGMAGACAKKQVAAPGLSAQEKAHLEAERQRRLREQRLREAQLKAAQERKLREIFENKDIHFEFDRYDLTPEAKQILNEKAAYLLKHPNVKIIIEGHCDERGSNAYNMALGEKRAKAAKAYLEAMGVDPSRMETVSYGEERPLDPRHTEEAYAINRRAHFVIKNK